MRINKLYKVREITNFVDMLGQSERLFGDKSAFVIKDKNGEHLGISFSKFKEDVSYLGTALMNFKLEEMIVCVIGENRYEWCLTYLSAVNAGGIIVPLDKELPLAEKINLIKKSNANVIVFSGKFSNDMKAVSKEFPGLKYFINMDIDEDETGTFSLKQLMQEGKKIIESGFKAFEEVHPDNKKMSILLFTSGTVGHAKGVMLSQENICSNITAICRTVYIDSKDSCLSILPLHHTYECTIGFLLMIYSGCTIFFNEGLKQISKNFREYKPTVLVTVPLLLESMYKKIWEHAAKEKGLKTKLKLALAISNVLYFLFRINIKRKLFKDIHENIGGNLRLVVTGAAAINPIVSKGFRDMGIPILQGYGLTECSPLVLGNRDSAFVDSSAGLPVPGVEVDINEPDKDGIGEIIVRGPNVMLGYYNNECPEKSSMKNGWFFTGDLGYRDKKGFYYITGRNKNVIVTKNGKNIFPEEVEACINRNPLVQESLVWGKYDTETGEVQVNAQILPNLEAVKEKLKVFQVSREDLVKVFNDVIKSINKDMPLYKHIRKYSLRDTEFIKTTTQKIKRYMEVNNDNKIKS